MIINAVLFLSYENTIVKTRNQRELPALCCMCLAVALFIIVLTACVFIVGRSLDIEFFVNFPSLPLLIVLLVITAFNQLFYNLSNRYEKYSLMAVANITQGLSQAFFRILLSMVKSLNGLILGNVLAQLSSVITYLVGLRRQIPVIYRSRPSLSEIRQMIRKYRNFPMFDAPGIVLEAAMVNMALIILSLYFPKSIIGCYSIIFQFMVLPISMVGSAMSKVYYKEISVAKEQGQIASVTKKVVKITFFLSLIPITFVVLGGDQFIEWYLGEKWEVAGNFALCLSMMSVPIVLTESVLPIYRVIDKQKTRFIFDLVCVIVGLRGMIIACETTTNIYRVLMVYVVLYTSVRFLLFFNVKKNSGMTLSVREWLLSCSCVVLCYAILAVRVYHLL
jgi:O-antigen/teichoic acid export membrane protein